MFRPLMLASLAIAAIAGAAQAQGQAQDTRTVKISLVGIDTRSEGGAVVILHRIKFAATAICGPQPSDSIDRLLRYDPCVGGVTQRTVARLGNPYLSALLTQSPGSTRQLASAR